MKTVWKYQLAMITTPLDIPKGGKVLFAACQGSNNPCIWVEVHPDAPKERRRFKVVGTGHPTIAPNMEYVGTCLDAPFVWHIYECK